ncbi:MAG: magnesium transporter, partial [bacterium]|nr:magnesium transporter [bacterium]
ETIYYVYVTRHNKLVGVVSLRDLIVAPLQTTLKDIMHDNIVYVLADTDQEEVAHLLSKYDFIAVPVIDSQQKILGLVTIDDVVDVLSAETTEDISKIGGSIPLDAPYLDTSVWSMFRKRIGWLMVLFIAQALTSTILKSHSHILQTAVSLTFFIPLLMDTGGNAGSQAATLVIRGMAVGEVRYEHVLKVLFKELCVGLGLGLVMGAVTLLRARMMGESSVVGLTVSLTILSIIIVAVLTGSLLPIGLKKVGVDPAVVSGPLVTTLVDTSGLLIYFAIAAKLMGII